MTESVVSTGFKEDALAVKSGEGRHGLKLNAPSRRARARRDRRQASGQAPRQPLASESRPPARVARAGG